MTKKQRRHKENTGGKDRRRYEETPFFP